MHIAVFGLGKLGAPLAAILASRGHIVVGVDVDERYVRDINERRAPVYETGLQDLLDQCDGRLSATTDGIQAATAAETIFIVVPTPSRPDHEFSTVHVSNTLGIIGEGIKKSANRKLVVLVSTVCPGIMDAVVVPELESVSGKKAMLDFDVLYNPEFIALGSVINDMLNPDFILIGEANTQAGDALENLYAGVCNNAPPIRRMNYVNAELTKLALNCYVTMKISYANMLGALCDKLPGSDATVVTKALGCDTRIGAKYLKPGLPFGGPCFCRDGRALLAVAKRIGADAPLAQATDAVNHATQQALFKCVSKHAAAAGGVVGLLGLAYKPNTSVLEESAIVKLAKDLLGLGLKVYAYEPELAWDWDIVSQTIIVEGLTLVPTALDCVQKSDVVVVGNPCAEFTGYQPSIFARPGQRRVVIDPWRVLDGTALADVAEYVTPGRCERD